MLIRIFFKKYAPRCIAILATLWRWKATKKPNESSASLVRGRADEWIEEIVIDGLKAVDLFSGCGGMSPGYQNVGI
ncbi:MAG: hypothetical protein FWC09_11030 [Lachnospiraceae bacterium]|nr:hypothetical protein [Lachnospiraceae bacterium]